MSKIIAVWGSSGSGKSMFCCILAKSLTQNKKKAIIINADLSTPMLPVWLPDQIIETGVSVGQVLSSPEIDTTLVASKVTVLKNYPFIGLMGFAAGENPLSYPEIKYSTVQSLVASAAKLVDYVILDCSSNMTNFFTPAAIESADTVVRILTPDLKGVNYLKAHQPLLTDTRFKYHEHLTFAGMARPFHALDEMGHQKALERLEKLIAKEKENLNSRYDAEERDESSWEMYDDGEAAACFVRIEVITSEIEDWSMDR